MVDEPGLRERKKQRTRQALVAAAIRLFEEQGYDNTTVAQIAAAAELSTRTFFLHFPAKEDVLLANAQLRIDYGVRAIRQLTGSAPMAEVLARAIDLMIDDSWETDLSDGLAAVRTRLIATEPALQSRLLQRYLDGQAELIDALQASSVDTIDPLDAAILVGAVLGAVSAAASTTLRRGDSPAQVRAAMHRANDLTLRR